MNDYSSPSPMDEQAIHAIRHNRPYPRQVYAPSPLHPTLPDVIVIAGAPRSGTTFLRRALHYGTGTALASEVDFIPTLYRKRADFGDLAETTNQRRLAEAMGRSYLFERMRTDFSIVITPDDILERLRGNTYTDMVYALLHLLGDVRPTTTRLAYKYPDDVLDIALIAEIIPTARFIHIIRDGRDVAASVLKRPWGPTTYYYAGLHWGRRVRAGQAQGAALGAARYLEIRYEQLFQNTDAVVAQIVQFIEGTSDAAHIERLTDYIHSTGKTERVQAWRTALTRQQRFTFEAAAAPMLQSLGYETEFGGYARFTPIQAATYRLADFLMRVASEVPRRWDRWRKKSVSR